MFQYMRGKGQGEGRLHSKCSIGIGGHISADDERDGTVPYTEGMRRELAEEVHIDTPYREQCVGLINDDQTEVGKVHLGVVHVFDVEHPGVRPREKDILEAGFRPLAAVRENRARLETWSADSASTPCLASSTPARGKPRGSARRSSGRHVRQPRSRVGSQLRIKYLPIGPESMAGDNTRSAMSPKNNKMLIR